VSSSEGGRGSERDRVAHLPEDQVADTLLFLGAVGSPPGSLVEPPGAGVRVQDPQDRRLEPRFSEAVHGSAEQLPTDAAPPLGPSKVYGRHLTFVLARAVTALPGMDETDHLTIHFGDQESVTLAE